MNMNNIYDGWIDADPRCKLLHKPLYREYRPSYAKLVLITCAVIILVFTGVLLTRVDADEITDIIPRLIITESSGNPGAISHKGCRGLTQFSKVAWGEVMDIPYLPNVYNPVYSKIACERYLRLLKKRLGKNYTMARMLAAYNMGLSKLKKLDYKYWQIRETKNYVNRILK